MENQLRSQLEAVVSHLHPDFREKGTSDLHALIDAGLNNYGQLLSVSMDDKIDVELRKIAIWFLGRLERRSSFDTLIATLHDTNYGLRIESARALGTLADDRCLISLSETLRSDSSVDVRMAAAYALGLIGSDEAVRVLFTTLNNTGFPSQVRAMAAESLGSLIAVEATDSLISTLNDSSPDLRFWSAFALGEIGDPRAISALDHLARTDPDFVPGWGSIREEAQKSIALITKGLT